MSGFGFSQSVPSYVPTNGLVGWWGFNGNAQDGSGNGNHGTVNGATLSTDRFGNQNSAYNFNGQNNRINITNQIFNLGWQNYTISAWFQTSNLNNANNFNNSSIILNTVPHNGIAISYYGTNNPFSTSVSNKISVLGGNGSGWNYFNYGTLVSNKTISAHTWNHVLLTRNGSNFLLYLNGNLSDSLFLNTSQINQTCELVFGNIAGTISSEGFLGRLDDYGIWNRTLSHQEISSLYQSGGIYESLSIQGVQNWNWLADDGFNVPSGSLDLGGVPFFIGLGGTGWAADRHPGANPRICNVPVSFNGCTEIFFLLNTIFGSPGAPLAEIKLFFSDGTQLFKSLQGNVDVRDYTEGFYTNTINNTTTVNIFPTLPVGPGGRRLDRVQFSIPSLYRNKTLTNIQILDYGTAGVQRLVLTGITLIRLNASLIPGGITIPNITYCQGDTSSVTISHPTLTGVANASLRMTYNPDSLTYVGFNSLNPAFNGMAINGTNGVITMDWNTSTNQTIVAGNMVNLRFRVNGNSNLSWDTLIVPSEFYDSAYNLVPQMLSSGSINHRTNRLVWNRNICEGQSFTLGNQSYTTSGTYHGRRFGTVGACDTLITLYLNVLPRHTNSLATICSNQHYTFGDGYDSSFLRASTEGGNGSSGITFNLRALKTIIIDSIFVPLWGGATNIEVWYSTTPISGPPFIGSLGWTRVVNGYPVLANNLNYLTTNLIGIPIPGNFSIPSGAVYGIFIGCIGAGASIIYTTYGTQIDTFTGPNMAIYTGPNVGYGGPAPYPSYATRQFCGAVSARNPVTVNTSGVYLDTLVNILGCDSIVQLNLTVNPAYNENLTMTICAGGSLQFGSQNLTVAGNYTNTFVSSRGCDSLVNLSLIVFNSTTIVSSNGQNGFCPNGSVRIGLANPQPNVTYTWRKDGAIIPNATSDTLSVNQTGNYQLAVQVSPTCIVQTNTLSIGVLNCNRITGDLRYDNNNQTPLAGIPVHLKSLLGNIVASDTTDSSGSYDMAGYSNGNYLLDAAINYTYGGVNSTDALQVTRFFTSLVTLSPLRIKVGDVNGSGITNSGDALLINRRITGLITSFSVGNFVNNLPSVSAFGNPLVANLRALSTGDVNGTYNPQPTSPVLVLDTVIGGVGSGTATVRFTTPGSGVFERGICWGTSPNPTVSGNKMVVGSGGYGFTRVFLGSMVGNQLHYARAYARNSSGIFYSNENSFIPPLGQPCPGTPTVTDIDGNIYITVQIGNQCWTQSNLKVSKYRNADNIPTGLSNSAWQNTTSGTYAIYNNDSVSDGLYGKLYNHYAVTDNRGLCPTGWHVPSHAEWTTLENHLGGISVAGGMMKSTAIQPTPGGWNTPNTGATNSSGFTALPGGLRDDSGVFNSRHDYGCWWSSSVSSGSLAFSRLLSYADNPIFRYYTNDRKHGFSVRCLKD